MGDAEDVDEDKEIRSSRGAIMNLIGNLDRLESDCRTTAMFNDPSLHLSFVSLSQRTYAVYASSQDMILMLLVLITHAGRRVTRSDLCTYSIPDERTPMEDLFMYT